MNKAIDNSMRKHDYEILFKDSPEYFVVKNAKMIQEGLMIRFIQFDENDNPVSEESYPIFHIHRIKVYYER